MGSLSKYWRTNMQGLKWTPYLRVWKQLYKILVDYREYLDKSKKVYPYIKTGVYFSQVKYYNLNPKHVHLTCKICWGKGHIANECKDKYPNYYKKKGSKTPTIPKSAAEALPIPTPTMRLINRLHNTMINKFNYPSLKTRNKFKERPTNYWLFPE